jgi:hypothetical protein
MPARRSRAADHLRAPRDFKKIFNLITPTVPNAANCHKKHKKTAAARWRVPVGFFVAFCAFLWPFREWDFQFAFNKFFAQNSRRFVGTVRV